MNLQLTINMRPDWTTSRYNCKKLNLANNVCYDTVLLNHIDQLLNSKKINFRQYPDEYIVYNTIAHYHLINAKNIAVGYGLGELITRILKLKLIKKIAIVSPTWPMVEVFCKILKENVALDLTLVMFACYSSSRGRSCWRSERS